MADPYIISAAMPLVAYCLIAVGGLAAMAHLLIKRAHGGKVLAASIVTVLGLLGIASHAAGWLQLN